MKEEESFDLHP